MPEDRHATGLILSLSVAENLFLRSVDRLPATRNWLLDRRAISLAGARIAEEFDIRPRNAELPASALSGDNQQKIILAREIAAARRVLIVVQPTKGLDVGAIAFVQAQTLCLPSDPLTLTPMPFSGFAGILFLVPSVRCLWDFSLSRDFLFIIRSIRYHDLAVHDST